MFSLIHNYHSLLPFSLFLFSYPLYFLYHTFGAKRATPKLLFIWYYAKVYPLQEILAFEFGMSQSTANEWIHILSKVLKEALDKGGYLPEREPEQLAAVLNLEPAGEDGIDGTERRIQRPSDDIKQAQYYSGKKKPTQLKIFSLALSRLKKSNT